MPLVFLHHISYKKCHPALDGICFTAVKNMSIMNKSTTITTKTAPSLTVVDGIATVNSLEVARHFGKRHDNVLRDIKDLCSQLPDEHLLNFEEMFRTFQIGQGATTTGLTYNLTRDGFTLLAMGFTGPKALAFKLAYIDAFNRMEAQLSKMYVEPLTNDKQFRKGIPMHMKFKLQAQGQKIMALLVRATHTAEQRNLYWQLRQVNDALGIPTESMEAIGIAAPCTPAMKVGSA